MESLKYTDEADRCYGAAGMAVSLVIYNGEDVLAGFSLDDATGNDTISLTPDFFFAGSPGVQATTAWRQILKNYNLGVAIVLGNVLCRHLVNRHHGVPSDVEKTLRTFALDEGADACQLEADEVKTIFDKTYNYLTRVFSHRGVQAVVQDFVSALQSRRTLSRHDALDLMSALSRL